MSFHQAFMDGLRALPTWQETTLHIALVIIGAWAFIKLGLKWVNRAMYRSRHVDDTLRMFFMNTVRMTGGILAAIVILAILGVDLAALVGGLAIGGFVIGFALKDTLGNLAAGVMLLFYRPFNVGDTVTIAGNDGEVTNLGMALTTMKVADGKIVTIPNGSVLGSAIVNHTREPIRRADVIVGIGYDDDIDAAVKAILEAVAEDPRVLKDPAPGVRITALGASSVDLQVRPWVNTDDFWQAKADLHKTVKAAVEAAGCTIPYPQQDVHLHQVAA